LIEISYACKKECEDKINACRKAREPACNATWIVCLYFCDWLNIHIKLSVIINIYIYGKTKVLEGGGVLGGNRWLEKWGSLRGGACRIGEILKKKLIF